MDGWGTSGLHATNAEGLGAGREGWVGGTAGRRGALPVQLRTLLHLRQVTHFRHSPAPTHSHSPITSDMHPLKPSDSLLLPLIKTKVDEHNFIDTGLR